MGILDNAINSLPDAPSEKKGSASIAPSGNDGIVEMLRNKAAEYGHDPDLFTSLASRESGFNPDAKNPGSSAGGLFQFLDSTWKQYGQGKNKFDPEANADAAARMLRDNMDRFGGDARLALAAHHVGPGLAEMALKNAQVGDKNVSTQKWLRDIYAGAGRDDPFQKQQTYQMADAIQGYGDYPLIEKHRKAQPARGPRHARPIRRRLGIQSA